MSQGLNNYFDDIPICLSYKLQVPPVPSLSNHCIDDFHATMKMLKHHKLKYDCSFELKVLKKIDALKIAQSREKDERENRIILKREEKRKILEAEENKLKEQLNRVSYPNPDELIDNDEYLIFDGVQHCCNNFDSMLTPIVAKLTNTKISSSNMNNSPENVYNFSKYDNKLELLEFENNTADPFDTTELQTINELDILAQVLKTSDVDANVSKDSSDVSSSNTKKQENKKEFSINNCIPNQQTIVLENKFTTKPYIIALSKNIELTWSGCNSNEYPKYDLYGSSCLPQSSISYGKDALTPTIVKKSRDKKNDLTLSLNKVRSKSAPDVAIDKDVIYKDKQ